ncbi:MAG: hypothetical protein DRN71_05350, partial [Candidatus Nanohalarchaeota archaeon]
MKNDVKLVFLVAVALLSIVIRLPGLQLVPIDDEAAWVIAMNKEVLDYGAIPHPPLSVLVYSLFVNVLGHDYCSLRFTAMVFGLLTLVVTYCLANEVYGLRVARISAVMMAILFYSILASLQIDMDGSILCFLTVSTLYAYFIYLKS